MTPRLRFPRGCFPWPHRPNDNHTHAECTGPATAVTPALSQLLRRTFLYRSLYCSADCLPLCQLRCVATRLRSFRHTYLQATHGMAAVREEAAGLAGSSCGVRAAAAPAARRTAIKPGSRRRSTHHSLCRSSQDLSRSSWANQGRPAECWFGMAAVEARQAKASPARQRSSDAAAKPKPPQTPRAPAAPTPLTVSDPLGRPDLRVDELAQVGRGARRREAAAARSRHRCLCCCCCCCC